MNRIYNFLRSDEAIMLFLVLALAAQVPHAADVFHRIIPYGPALCDAQSDVLKECLLEWVHAYAYAIALESAILIFVMRGKMGLSWGFAIVSVLVNVGYYWSDAWTLSWDAPIADMLRAALVSLALPGAIAFYSHEVGGKHEPEASPEAPMAEPPAEWVGILVDAVLDAIEREMGEAHEAPEEVPDASDEAPEALVEAPMPEPVPSLPAGWGIDALVDAPLQASMPEPVPTLPIGGICYASECREPGEACERCGHPVCPKHTGTHKRWHCVPVVHANGHTKEAM